MCVPFVLRLRAFTTADELPLPEDFLRASGVPLHGSAPAGWAERLLTGGRALVLADGVDKVPTRQRSRTETWLRSLISAFPEARYVVTTRPSAVPEDWLTGHGFTAHSLLPMESGRHPRVRRPLARRGPGPARTPGHRARGGGRRRRRPDAR
ncbi:NACHT domain-containing protein [Streptomyces scopuliridis]|uniref:NACHT domain-containing protein n=1 Tax=Streptomyces scopuliridis TaxID=452529 RepID=UPI00406BB860